MMNTMHRKTVPGLFLMLIFGLLLTIVPAHSNADGNDQSIENFVQFALDLADAGKSKTDLGITVENKPICPFQQCQKWQVLMAP